MWEFIFGDACERGKSFLTLRVDGFEHTAAKMKMQYDFRFANVEKYNMERSDNQYV